MSQTLYCEGQIGWWNMSCDETYCTVR